MFGQMGYAAHLMFSIPGLGVMLLGVVVVDVVLIVVVVVVSFVDSFVVSFVVALTPMVICSRRNAVAFSTSFVSCASAFNNLPVKHWHSIW